MSLPSTSLFEKAILDVRNNPPTFDNITGDNAPENRRHAAYGWVKACNRILAQYEFLEKQKTNPYLLEPEMED